MQQNRQVYLDQWQPKFYSFSVDVPGMRETNVGHVLDDYNSADLRLLVLHRTTLTDNINCISISNIYS